MKPMSLVTPEAVAKEYGGNKNKIREATLMGLLDPTVALMAGMHIDKMRAAAAAEQKQNTTVVEDTFGLGGLQPSAAPTAPPAQAAPAQGLPAAQMAMAPQGQPMMRSSGVEALPAGDVGNYAGGGIVAFARGGDLPEGDLTEDDIRRMTPPHEYVQGRGFSSPETFAVPMGTDMEQRQIFDPFSMGATTPRERLAAQLAFPPSEIGKVAKAPTPNMEVPSRTGKSRNRLIDPEFRTSDTAKLAKAKLDILQGELANQQQALAIAKAPDEKARAEANIKEIQREISIASKGSKAAPSAPTPDSPRDKAIYDEKTRPEDFVGQARRIAEGVYPASERPTELTVDTAFEQSQKFLDKAGVDLNVFKKQREDIAEERRGYEKDKKQAGAFRILEAAAGILSGESQYGMVNIGKGLTPAVQGLASDVKEFQKNERALRAAERQLAADEQKFNITRASDAQTQMLKSMDRVDAYNKNKANLVGDITKSFISTQGSKEVAEVYTKGYERLEGMRQEAPPDVVKLADRLKKDMPNHSERERIEAAAKILRPERTMGATIGAVSKARQDASAVFQNMLQLDPTTKALKKKADAGDAEAKRQLAAIENDLFEKELGKLDLGVPGAFDRPSSGGGAGTPGGEAKPGQFSVTAPNGKVYNFPTKDQADAFKAQIGG
jgi:hypothetical protein